MADKAKNIFISHVHEDDDGLKKLKAIAKDNGLDVRDYSINSSNPNKATSEDYIKNEILAPRIDQCSVLVVYITPDTKDSHYVDWEIAYAHAQGMRVVGVWAWGEKGCDLPQGLDDLADAVVGWNGSAIVDAITGKFNGFERPDGTPPPTRSFKRHPC